MDNPISLLNPATVLTDADVLPIVNGSETKKVSIATIKAQTNVNADWNATTGVAQILNKPTIPTETSVLTNDGADGVNPFITALDIPIYGQAGTLVREVRNTTGATLTKGTVVYINGASGNKPTVTKALATSDALSARTFGLLQSDILHNENGYCVVVGDLSGLNTNAFTDGQQLYLSGTVAGTYTATKTLAPTHLVYIGKVTRAHPTQGQIEVQIQNGYELEEIHDCKIVSPINNQALVYNEIIELWENKSISNDELNHRTNGYVIFNEFTSLLTNGSWFPTAISTGTIVTSTAGNYDEHCGVVTMSSSATVNSGYYWSNVASANVMLFSKLIASLQSDMVFKLPSTGSINTVIRFGFATGSVTVAEFTSGIFIRIIGSVLTGVNTNATISSSTTSVQLDVEVWYHTRVKVLSLTSIQFSVYLMDGTLVSQQTLSANIPTNLVLNPILITTNPDASITQLINVDYVSASVPTLQRGALT